MNLSVPNSWRDGHPVLGEISADTDGELAEAYEAESIRFIDRHRPPKRLDAEHARAKYLQLLEDFEQQLKHLSGDHSGYSRPLRGVRQKLYGKAQSVVNEGRKATELAAARYSDKKHSMEVWRLVVTVAVSSLATKVIDLLVGLARG